MSPSRPAILLGCYHWSRHQHSFRFVVYPHLCDVYVSAELLLGKLSVLTPD